MAYVKVTDKLKDDIRSKISRMAEKQTKILGENNLSYEEQKAVAADVEKFLWKDAPHLKDQMPSNWTSKAQEFYAELRNENFYTAMVKVELAEEDAITLPPKAKIGKYAWDKLVLPFEFHSEQSRAAYEKLVNHKHKLAETNNKFSDIQQQVLSFISAHKSLNAALKELPEIQMYVPYEYMERVNRKVERANASAYNDEVEKPEVNRELLMSAAVADRIMK
jgi:hypothetical protein